MVTFIIFFTRPKWSHKSPNSLRNSTGGNVIDPKCM